MIDFSMPQPALAMWLLKATALLLAALTVTALLRRASAGTRHLVWVGTLAAVLLLPVLSSWTPMRLQVLPTSLARATLSSTTSPEKTPPMVAHDKGVSSASGLGSVSRGSAASQKTPMLPAIAPLQERHVSIGMVLLVLWASATSVLLAWLTFGALSVRRIVRSGRSLDDDRAWSAPLCEIADRLDLEAVPRLLASDLIEMPFACGVLRPTVVLPAKAEQWNDSRRRAVLFHELAHVKRRDLVGHTLGRLACAFYWFHPLVWTAARRLRAESERACDDLVLSCGAKASDYADHLLDIVISVRRYGAPATAMPMARRRELEGRVLAILDPAVQRIGPGRLQSLGLVATSGVLALCVAAMSPKRDAGRAVRDAGRAAPPQEAVAPLAQSPLLIARTNQQVSLHNGIAHRNETTAAGPTVTLAPAPSPASMPSISVSRTSGEATIAGAIGSVAQVAANSAVGALSELVKQAWASKGSKMDSSKVALLVKVLHGDRDASVRRMAAWGLSEVSDAPEVLTALTEALHGDEDEDVREMAAWALSDSHHATAGRALADALRNDESDKVRETAAWALGESEADDQRGALDAALTSDPASEVRESAAWALGYMPQRPAAHGLVVALRDKNSDVRETAAWALAEIQDEDTAPAISDAFMKEPSVDVRTAELRALSFLHADDKDVLDAALSSKDAELRARAVRMLAGAGAGAWPEPRPRPRPRPMP